MQIFNFILNLLIKIILKKMKNLIPALFIFTIFALSSNVIFSQSISMETYLEKEPAQGEFDNRVPAKSFEIKNGVDPVIYFKYETMANGAWETHPLNLIVVKDDGTVAYNYSFDPGGSSGIYYTSSSIPEGNYTSKIVDGNDESNVWCKKDFTVSSAMTKVAGSKNVIACDYVDDNWNPIGAVTTFKAGECMNLYVRLPEILEGVQSIGWEIYKVKKNGKEEFVAELMLNMPTIDNLIQFATTEKICYF